MTTPNGDERGGFLLRRTGTVLSIHGVIPRSGAGGAWCGSWLGVCVCRLRRRVGFETTKAPTFAVWFSSLGRNAHTSHPRV